MWSPGDEFYLDLGQTTNLSNLSNIGNTNGLLSNTLKNSKDSFDSDENISGETMSSP